MARAAGLFPVSAIEIQPGARHIPGYLSEAEQDALLAELRAVVRKAPFFQPVMPRTGKPFSVRMTNCGVLGWVSDRAGYRYQETHPVSGSPWPPLPERLLTIWSDLAPGAPAPEAALINHYRSGARMGLHRDEDEQDSTVPVVSLSIGDAARFRVGGTDRRDATRSVRLESGDAFVLAGPSRLAYHGIDRIYDGTSDRLAGGGRLNITLRRVTSPEGLAE
ncbi:MAG: alpha-ketoglutarate-dependent dioxygenase AlkB [Pseudomonadota bacterium]